MNYVGLLPAYWELLRFTRVVSQHAVIVAAAGLLCLLVFSPVRSRLAAAGLRMLDAGAFRGLLLAFGFGACLAVSLAVLQNFPNSADEYACLFLGKCFASNQLYGATDSLAEFFNFTHIGEKDGKWFSVYPPGWPLFLAAGLIASIPWLINPLLAALTLFVLYRIGLRVGDRRSALLACAWVGSSSFFLLNAGSYYSHVCCLFLLTAFTWCYMRAMDKEDGHPRVWLFASGLLLGYAMMTRYLSAAAYAAPFGIYFLYRAVVKKDVKVADFIAIGAGLAVFNLAQLWFQYRVTGDPFLTPIHYLHEHEKLGFSRAFPPWEGLGFTAFRWLFYAQWVVPVFWVFAVLAFFAPGKKTWDKIFLWAALLCGGAYALYYSFGGNGYGPRYYFESLGLLGIMGAKTFFAVWDKWKGTRGRAFLGWVLALGFLVNGWNTAKDLSICRKLTLERKSLYNAAAAAGLNNSVVFVRDWVGTLLPMPPGDLTRNSPQRDDPVLYVHDLGEKNRLLMEAMPQRSFYVGVYDKETATARLIPVTAPEARM